MYYLYLLRSTFFIFILINLTLSKSCPPGKSPSSSILTINAQGSHADLDKKINYVQKEPTPSMKNLIVINALPASGARTRHSHQYHATLVTTHKRARRKLI